MTWGRSKYCSPPSLTLFCATLTSHQAGQSHPPWTHLQIFVHPPILTVPLTSHMHRSLAVSITVQFLLNLTSRLLLTNVLNSPPGQTFLTEAAKQVIHYLLNMRDHSIKYTQEMGWKAMLITWPDSPMQISPVTQLTADWPQARSSRSTAHQSPGPSRNRVL